MGKYDPLRAFLGKQHATEVPLTFQEIEKITGVKLPPKAQHHRAWWSNNPSNNVMTKVWLEAGYETERVDMAGHKLVFRRTRRSARETTPAFPAVPARVGHPLIGALKGLAHVPPGIDLTEPACPE